MRRFLRFFFIFSAVALTGLGCSSSSPSSSTQTRSTHPTQSRAATSEFPTFPPQIKTMTPKDDLVQAIQKFKDTKSFRATVKADVGKGAQLIGGIEFMKPNRFRALIANSATSTTELIIVDNDLYMRVNTRKWVQLTTSHSRATGESLRNVMSGNEAIEKQILDDSVTVDKTDDLTRSCTLYRVHPSDHPSSTTLSVCVTNGLPAYADIPNPNGMTHIHYFDYNAIFTIAKPF